MPTLLYLVRHADAIDLVDDHARTLSKKGRNQVAHLARFLAPSGAFHPTEVWHSPLVRAQETAELLTSHLELKVRHSEHPELEPTADPVAVVRKLHGTTGALALVGHEPHLSSLASLLVTGSTSPVVFTMRKGSILALEHVGSRWSVHWHISPQLLG